METIPQHPLIIVTEQDIKKVRASCGLDDVKMIQDHLDAIDEWCKKQDHLVEAYAYIDRSMLERLILLAKGSLEGTKKHIDRLLTSRGMMPDLCLNRTVEEFEKFWDIVNYIPLPKTCPTDQTRVMITQFVTDKLEDFSILTYLRYCFLVGEYRIHHDYLISERYILDLKNVHIGILSKLNPLTLKKAEILCTEGFGTKIKGIHILNAPPFVDKVVFILKQGLKEKVASRLHVHQSYEDLHKHVPKEILPVDYGGDEISCSKLAAQWKDLLKTKECMKIIQDSDKWVADESKRTTAKFNEEYLGMPGSFRKLNVD
ncbi:uncharacterized protein [Epargyreus clarus]|uniref:uncharacterized protein n=1 Tax=Epargyreus clarus TaxID=520877 RepID=UPI003C2CC66B